VIKTYFVLKNSFNSLEFVITVFIVVIIIRIGINVDGQTFNCAMIASIRISLCCIVFLINASHEDTALVTSSKLLKNDNELL